MEDDVLLARDRNGYRVISGQHRLEAVLGSADEVFAAVEGEGGCAKVFRTPQGLVVCKDSRNLPLLGQAARG